MPRRSGPPARRCSSLIDEILDFSKIEAGTLELDARAVRPDAAASRTLVELLAPRAHAKGIEIAAPRRRRTCRALSSAMPGALRQILLNLAGNAVKFTEGGGVAHRRARTPGERIAFEVARHRDRHRRRGSSRASSASSTRPTSTPSRRFGGTGLGLAISQRSSSAWAAPSPSTAGRAEARASASPCRCRRPTRMAPTTPPCRAAAASSSPAPSPIAGPTLARHARRLRRVGRHRDGAPSAAMARLDGGAVRRGAGRPCVRPRGHGRHRRARPVRRPARHRAGDAGRAARARPPVGRAARPAI